MNALGKIIQDFLGLCRVCGPSAGVRWLGFIARNAPTIARSGNLTAADAAMGDGPFRVKFNGLQFKIAGPLALSGIREMYVRDTYLRRGLLDIRDGDTVLDLGANIGNFSNLALAHGANVHVVAIEPNAHLLAVFEKSVALNDGFPARVQVIRAYLGKLGKLQSLAEQDPGWAGAPWMTPGQLVEQGQLKRIDFLKCDIEGGEFGLLMDDPTLLSMTTSIAIEIHAFAGSVPSFLKHVEACGFSILLTDYASDGSCTALATRSKP